MIIAANNNAGLANKIKNIVSAIFMAERLEDVVVLPEILRALITVEQDEEKQKKEIINFSTWQLLPEDVGSDLSRFLVNPSGFSYQVWSESGRGVLDGVDFQYHNINDWGKTEILKRFSRLKINEEILVAADKLLKINEITCYVGVHVRTWWDDLVRKRILFNEAILLEVLSSIDPQIPLFCCADDMAFIAKLRSIFPKRKIFCSSQDEQRIFHSAYNPSANEVHSALLDLILLAKSDALVGSYQSTFTEVGWWLGGGKQSIYVPTPKMIKIYRELEGLDPVPGGISHPKDFTPLINSKVPV